jgi:hypothetical protein
MPKIKQQTNKQQQVRTSRDDFKSVAKRLECDEDKGRFEAKLGKLAKAKPKPAEKA